MLQAGSQAPDFTLPDEDGNDVSLSGLLQGGAVILYFYPADFTPFCTREACSIRDMHDEIVASGLRVIGISPQEPDSHRRFRERYRLPFPLLSDVDKKVARNYDVVGLLGLRIRRATYLISPGLISQGGLIEDAVLADIRVARHEEFIRKAIELRGERSAN